MPREKYSNGLQPFDLEAEVKKVKAVSKELRAVFKEHTIRKLSARTASGVATPKSQELVKAQGIMTVEQVLKGVQESQKYYELNKRNQNSCHPGETDAKTGEMNEE
jgi:hypothetical protein